MDDFSADHFCDDHRLGIHQYSNLQRSQTEITDRNVSPKNLREQISVLKQYFVLSKGLIVLSVLIGGLVGYAFGLEYHQSCSLRIIGLLLTGMYFLSSGSFILNQAQEHQLDRKMERTSQRPIPSGGISLKRAYLLGLGSLVLGLLLLYFVSLQTSLLGLATVVLYNVFYTLIWKRFWVFGAVPGALPGAMPVVLGYSASHGSILTNECLYLFLLMFLWQMPHFWAIAIKCGEDYQRGGIPVPPVKIGEPRTIFHIGLYVFVYLALALGSPWFVPVGHFYLYLVVPVALILLFNFIRYVHHEGQKGWLSFFVWTNLSVIIFLLAPVFDKWQNFYSLIQ